MWGCFALWWSGARLSAWECGVEGEVEGAASWGIGSDHADEEGVMEISIGVAWSALAEGDEDFVVDEGMKSAAEGSFEGWVSDVPFCADIDLHHGLDFGEGHGFAVGFDGVEEGAL
jgi:hypothetical protein